MQAILPENRIGWGSSAKVNRFNLLQRREYDGSLIYTKKSYLYAQCTKCSAVSREFVSDDFCFYRCYCEKCGNREVFVYPLKGKLLDGRPRVYVYDDS